MPPLCSGSTRRHGRSRRGAGPRSFDPVALGRAETDAWAAYYRHEWRTFLRSTVAMVAEGFGMDRARALAGAWWVLRANQQWAPHPDNDPDGAGASMRRFYALVARDGGFDIDPATAAAYEVEWWRLYREHQHDPAVSRALLEDSLVDLYAYVYAADRDLVRPAAGARVDAMDLSDRSVAAGARRENSLLAHERVALQGGSFVDPAWVEEWDVAFARLYLDALDAELGDGTAAPRPWRPTRNRCAASCSG